MSREYIVAVVGATGAVGREMLEVLEERAFPVAELRPLASEKSAGSELMFKGQSVTVEKLTEESFEGVDFALFSAGGGVSKDFAPIAAKSGAIVIDNSSQWRMDPQVPLVVPEVNSAELRDRVAALGRDEGLIIANPNCSTIQLVVALKPIQDTAGLKRVIVSTYQSVSGAGQKGIEELWNQTLAIFNQGEVISEKFPKQIAFNCFPHIDVFLENGYTKEEMKVVHESRKILGLPNLKITVTAVRVPTFSCHAEAVNIETDTPLTPSQAREVLMESPGILVVDEPGENKYPVNIDVAGTDATYVGRIRRDESVENGLNMWVVADNLRKGAALNAVQIAEVIVNSGLR